MDWKEQLFIYCERGSDPSFWAEPFNAISNLGFLIAAAAAFAAYLRKGGGDRAEGALIVIVATIGAGSFLFHTFATRWAAIADIAPIGVFMLAYLAFALLRFLGAPWWVVGVALAAFLLAGRSAALCPVGLLPVTEAAGRPCFNGSLAYSPALLALFVLAAMLAWRGHPATARVGAAALLLAASLTLRTLDVEVCPLTDILGQPRGAHALWHALNAGVLYLLLMAAIESPARESRASGALP